MKFLKYTNDYRAIFLVLLSTFLLISPLFGILSQLYWVPLKIIFSVICHAINHNHQHFCIFYQDSLNKFFSVLLSITLGQSGSSTIAMHQLNHHGHNNSDLDLANSRLVNYRWNFLNLLLYPFIIINNYRNKKNLLINDLEEKRQGIKKTIAIELWAIRLFALVYLLINWQLFLLFVLIPYICGVWAILAINLIQHQLSNEKNDFDLATNFTGYILNYLLLNNGYHSAHHQYPHLHWSQLPHHHKEMEKDIPPLFIKKSLFHFIISHFLFNFKPPLKVSNLNIFEPKHKLGLMNRQHKI